MCILEIFSFIKSNDSDTKINIIENRCVLLLSPTSY